MGNGKVFEEELIKVLREKFHWDIVTDLSLDRKEAIDWMVVGWRGRSIPVIIDFQVSQQDTNGRKIRAYESRSWLHANGHAKVYFLAAASVEVMFAAQAVHHALWRDLVGNTALVMEDERIGLYIDESGMGEYFELNAAASDLNEKSRAKAGASGRKRGRIIDIEHGRIAIKSGDKEYYARFTDVIGNAKHSALNVRKKIRPGLVVTFRPVGIAAFAIMLAKHTTKRFERATGSST
jgi:hypothetical protein